MNKLTDKVELTAGTDTEELEPLGEGPVYALKGFAYRCAQDVSFASINTTREYTLRFNDIKVGDMIGVTYLNVNACLWAFSLLLHFSSAI